jgi:hypothetical protein
LHSIHLRGYIHGAVTFANVLVQDGPQPDTDTGGVSSPFLLADAGLAQFARRFGQQQNKQPLPITAAPEQIGRRIIPASDQFALAVLLYFWLAGRPPYIGTPEEIERLKLTETITPLSVINSRVSIDQDGMLLRALSVFPEDRYPTIMAFAEALISTISARSDAPPADEAVATTQAPEPSDAASQSEPAASPAQPEPLNVVEQPQPEAESEPVLIAQNIETEPERVIEFDSQPEAEQAPALQDKATEPEQRGVPGSEKQEAREPASIDQGTATQREDAITTEEVQLEPEQVVASEEVQEIPQTDSPQRPETTQGAHPSYRAFVIITSPYTDDPIEFALEYEEISAGRAGSSDIPLDHDNMTSRHHALFRRTERGYAIYDRQSANGVFVNGQKIDSEAGYELVDGDHISIGNYELIFRLSPANSDNSSGENAQTHIAQQELSQLI